MKIVLKLAKPKKHGMLHNDDKVDHSFGIVQSTKFKLEHSAPCLQ